MDVSTVEYATDMLAANQKSIAALREGLEEIEDLDQALVAIRLFQLYADANGDYIRTLEMAVKDKTKKSRLPWKK